MTPIISPWIVYAIDILCTLEFLCSLGAVLLGIFIVMEIVDFEVNNKNYSRCFKKASILFVLFIIASILIPSKEAMLNMLVLSYVTPDNISLVQDNIVDFVGKIVGVVKELK